MFLLARYVAVGHALVGRGSVDLEETADLHHRRVGDDETIRVKVGNAKHFIALEGSRGNLYTS